MQSSTATLNIYNRFAIYIYIYIYIDAPWKSVLRLPEPFKIYVTNIVGIGMKLEFGDYGVYFSFLPKGLQLRCVLYYLVWL